MNTLFPNAFALLCAVWLCSLGVTAQTRTQEHLQSANHASRKEEFVASIPLRASTPPAREITAQEILAAKQRLAALGYWIEPKDEEFTEQLRFAILAFQRAVGRKPTGRLTLSDFQVLKRARKLESTHTGEAHIEVSLTKQLLFRVDAEGKVRDILPITTGTGRWFTADGRRRRAVTPTGTFTVYRKIEGWHESPFGDMYYSSYIVGGVAIHGSRFITNHPRTYGCIAVPLFAAERLSELMPIGTLVVVTK